MSGEKDNHNQAQQPEPESNNAANKETAAALKVSWLFVTFNFIF